MIGDRHVFVTERERLRHHGVDRITPVAPVCVHMEVAADIRARNQCRQPPLARGVDLVAFIAQFGRYEGQAERRVNVGFCRCQKTPVIDRSQAFVVQQAPPIHGELPKPVEVLLASSQLDQ